MNPAGDAPDPGRRTLLALPWLQDANIRRLARLGSEASVVAVGQLLAGVAAVIGVRLLTERLSVAEYGTLALWLTGVSFSQTVLLSPITQVVLRFVPGMVVEERLALWGMVNGISKRANAVVLFAFTAAGALAAAATDDARVFLLSVSVGTFATVANSVLLRIASLGALRRRVRSSLVFSGIEWLRYGLGAVAAAVIGGPLGVMIGFIAAYTLGLFLVRSPFGAAKQLGKPTDLATQYRKYAMPFVLWGLAAWLQSASDRWALQFFASTEEVGMIAVLGQLAVAPMVMLGSAVSQLMAPIIFARAGTGDDPKQVLAGVRLIGKCTVGFLGATSVLTLMAFFARHGVFSILVAKRFREIAPLWPVAMAAGALVAASYLLQLAPMTLGRPAKLLPLKVAQPFLATLAAVAGAIIGGVPLIVFFSLLSGVATLAWSALLYRQVLRSVKSAPPP